MAIDCIEWAGAKNEKGYGQFTVWRNGKKTSEKAHRQAYIDAIGPIPEGMSIDHLCRNKSCVNPAHLEVVTPAENTRRRFATRDHIRKNPNCPKGHPYSEANTYIYKGTRNCRTCRNIANDRTRKVG